MVDTERFLSMETLSDLSYLLSIPTVKLVHTINNAAYYVFEIPKKNGGGREIEAPFSELKGIQAELNSYLQKIYSAVRPRSTHGFVTSTGNEKVNIVSNAQAHAGKEYVMCLDLKSFFPSIKSSRVKKVFMTSPFAFDEKLAVALALLCTYEGHLPTGAPTSPVLSNFVSIPLDKTLTLFARLHHINYTRYADDLTFSSDSYFSKEMIAEITNMIEQYFELNNSKFRIQNKHRRQTVTGLTVNKAVNINRQYLKRIRAMLHSIKVIGIEKAALRHYRELGYDNDQLYLHETVRAFKNQIRGMISFVGMVKGVENKQFLDYKNQYNNYVEE